MIKNYGWQEEASIPYLMKVFELSLEETRKVIVVGALPHKLYIETLAKIFKKDHGKKSRLSTKKFSLKTLQNRLSTVSGARNTRKRGIRQQRQL